VSLAHSVLDDLRRQGAGLDGSDGSLWFIQGLVASMSWQPKADDDLILMALAVYLAETLASTCPGVRVVVDAVGNTVSQVAAVGPDGRHECVLSWVLGCRDDPDGSNVVFNYSAALRAFGQPTRAAALDEQLAEYTASRNRTDR
jgi:hypothetical protein